ncbi:hypothetical protein GALMADRAFT_282181 [Galerina marginata CBS 339.88]|uniref:Uncharacterized protein n=1 Tax=Galerina marginata (strain CBS 339.88) TaxID=685588 RepID=A0A067SHG9_GALM3|nr:hypothetical protein GALMADRAFT_282181 [Galerina marginata CBS 339.88]
MGVSIIKTIRLDDSDGDDLFVSVTGTDRAFAPHAALAIFLLCIEIATTNRRETRRYERFRFLIYNEIREVDGPTSQVFENLNHTRTQPPPGDNPNCPDHTNTPARGRFEKLEVPALIIQTRSVTAVSQWEEESYSKAKAGSAMIRNNQIVVARVVKANWLKYLSTEIKFHQRVWNLNEHILCMHNHNCHVIPNDFILACVTIFLILLTADPPFERSVRLALVQGGVGKNVAQSGTKKEENTET